MRPHRRIVVRGAAALLAVLGGTAACGTRLSQEQLAADARTEVVGTRGGAGAGDGGADSAGADDGAALDDLGPVEGTGGAAPGTDGGTESGSAGSATGGGAAAPAQAQQQCTGDEKPIVIGTVGQQTGIAGAAVADGPRAVAAWAASVNARGGLHCHQVRYLILDDGGDPSRNQSLVRQLVEREGAIAIVQENAPLSMQGTRSYLESKGIPVVGSVGGFGFYYEIPTFFPHVAAGPVLGSITSRGAAAVLTPEERRNVGAITCLEQATCLAPVQAMPEAGLTLVYHGQASLTTLDFTSQCTAAKQAGAKVLFTGMDPNSIVRIAASCRSVSYAPKYVASASVVVPSLGDDPNLEGMIVPTQAKPWMLADDPAIAELHQALARYAPGVEPSGPAVVGWAAAKLFERAAAALGPTPTSEDLLDGLYAIRDDDLGGLVGPLTFTRGRPAPKVACWFTVVVRDGGFTSPDGGQRRCA